MRKQRQFLTTQVLDTTKRKYTITLPRDKYMYALHAHFRGRLRVTAAATTVLPEGILNLLERFRIRMTHEIYGSEIVADMYGPSLYYYRHFYRGFPARNNTSVPLLTTVAEIDYDFNIDYVFPPERIFPADQEFYLLDAPRTTLFELDLEWGNAASAIEGGTTSLSNFGATTGNPEVDIEYTHVLDKENLPLVALVKRNSFEQDISGSPFPVTNDKIRDLPTGEAIRSVMVKQFTRSTTAGQPTSVVATILNPIEPEVDAGITRLGVRVNDRYIVQARSWPNLQEVNRNQHNLEAVPSGYSLLEFVEDGNIDRVLFTQDFVEKRMRLDVAGSVVTGTNNRAEYTVTSVRPNPRLGG